MSSTQAPTQSTLLSTPEGQAFALLRTVFTVAPILFGLDKFFNILFDWPTYLAPLATNIVPLSDQQFMYVVGIIEIVAGITVAIAPRFGSLLVAAWLLGIIINYLIIPGYFDIALRDFGLFVGALALWRLTTGFAQRR